MRPIEVDLDVHKALESRRSSFDQTHNQILRELLGLAPPSRPSETRSNRSSGDGKYTIQVGDKVITEGSMKLAYKRAIAAMAKADPNFLQRLGELETPGRRIVARSAERLYKSTPSLISFAEPLERGWWIDTNLSRQQAISRLMMACRVANLEYGIDVRVAF
jgi:hypothetical protein